MNTPALISKIVGGKTIFETREGVDTLKIIDQDTRAEVSMPPHVLWEYIGECYKREQVAQLEDFPVDYFMPRASYITGVQPAETCDCRDRIDWRSVGLGVCVAAMVGLLLLSAFGKV